nr:hypothetical protein [Tanacetum cinerariifolium]
MNEFCEEKGIKREYSVARTPRQNRVAERRNRILIEAAKTMLADSKLPTTFWAEAVNTACYVQNRVLVVKPHFKTLYELFKGRSPALSFMRPFGCHVTILNTLDQLGKFDGKSDEGIFVSYSTNSKAFRAYNIRTRKEQTLMILQVKEQVLMQDKHGPSPTSESDNQERPDAESSAKTVNTAGPVNTATPTYANYPNDSLMPDLEDARIFDDAYDDRDEGAEADYNNLEIEISVEAMQEELFQFKLLNVWTLVDLSSGKRAIGTKWVYRNKRDQRGIVVRNKSRLVAQGHRQEEGIDYDEVFAPVARIKAIRLFMAYLSFMDFTVYQMDVKSALLYGTIEDEVYVSQPPGFVDPEFPDRVYKVEKALYGLHQAPRAWYETLSTYLLDDGFRRGKIDKTLFIKQIKDDILLVQVYVDDIILVLQRGFQVEQQKDGIFLSQDKYVCDILKKFGFSSVKSASTPMETHKPLSKDVAGTDVDVYLYSDYAGASLDRKSTTEGLKLKGYLINDGYADLVQHADKKELDITGKTTTGKELSNPLMAGSLPKTTLPTQLLNDAEGTSCLPNAMIFKELARMGYEKPSEKLTFYKAFFSPQWKFFIHTILQCLSAKTTSWNEFNSTMASSIICLANNQKFNFLKYILDNLKKNLEAGVPFYMFPRKHKPRRKEKKERKETEVSLTELPTEDPIPTTSNDLLPSGDDSMQLKELMILCINLSNKVLDLENKVIKMKSSHQAKIAVLESGVEKAVLSMHDATDADGKEVPKELVEVITTAKIIVDEVSTAGGELNAANEEPVSAALTNITTAQPSEATKTTVDIFTAPKAKGLVFHDMEESTTRTAYLKVQIKDKCKAKLVDEPKVLKLRKAQIAIDAEVVRRIKAEWNADMQDNIVGIKLLNKFKNITGFKIEFFKGMSYEEIRPMFEEEYNKVQTLFKKGPKMDAERIKAPRKRTRKEEVKKDQTTKKQKGDELEKKNAEKQKLVEQQEAKELKRNLEIVHYDEDDVFVNFAPLSSKPLTIMDYKIYKEGKKEHFQIIRANECSLLVDTSFQQVDTIV